MNDKQIRFSKPIFLFFLLILTFAGTVTAIADVTLPAVISDNMVLQRGRKVPIWGWAEPGEKVKIKGNWQWLDASTRADKYGKWMVKLSVPKKAGPYKISIKGNNTIILDNVLAGEVWVCSGQSNMAFTVRSSNNWPST